MKKAPSTGLAQHLPGLDGLRGVACLMVFAVHFGQMAKVHNVWGPFDLARLLENGNSGVALFFALSGFLLGLPFWRAQVLGNLPPSSMLFLTRRVARVAPAYFLCLTALIVVNRLWQEDDWLRNALLHYAFAFNYFDATIFSINPPFWTIAVEMQFYLMLPLIFWVCGRLRPAQAALCITALAFLAYAAHLQISASAFKDVALGGQISPVVSYSLLAHLPHFLFGVVAGWLVNSWQAPCWSPTERTVPLLEAALWCAIVLLFVIMATPLDELLQVPYGRYNLPYVPLLFCVLIVLTPFTATGWLLLQHTPLRAVGSVSYGVYLYHLPVLHVVSRWMARAGQNPHDDWLMFSMTSLMVTLAAATLSYHFFEKPILGLIARRQVLIQARRCNP